MTFNCFHMWILSWRVRDSWRLLITNSDVLGYWRRRSDCYFVLFTTSLVVTTITWTRLNASSFRVASFSWLVLWLLASWLLLWSLFYLISSPWNRVLAPWIEDTLSKDNFSSVVQVVTGITFVNIRYSDDNCLPSCCLGIATIRSLFVEAGERQFEPLPNKCSHLS
jgi:hypothetical protein